MPSLTCIFLPLKLSLRLGDASMYTSSVGSSSKNALAHSFDGVASLDLPYQVYIWWKCLRVIYLIRLWMPFSHVLNLNLVSFNFFTWTLYDGEHPFISNYVFFPLGCKHCSQVFLFELLRLLPTLLVFYVHTLFGTLKDFNLLAIGYCDPFLVHVLKYISLMVYYSPVRFRS